MPIFLFFVIELSTEKEYDIKQFRNLIKSKNVIKKYIEEEIIFNNIQYKF